MIVPEPYASSTDGVTHIDSCCIAGYAYCGAAVDPDKVGGEICWRCAASDAADWCAFCGTIYEIVL